MAQLTRALAPFAPAPVPPGATLLPAFVAAPAVDRVYCCDWMDLLRAQPAQSVDLMLTDMPYGITACEWDHEVDLALWWELVKRVVKPRAAVVCTASQPFTSRLVMSNLAWFRYEWIWRKNRGTNFLNTKSAPMKEHENILVWSEKMPRYFPVNIPRSEKGIARASGKYNLYQGKKREAYSGFRDAYRNQPNPLERIPSSVLSFNDEHGIHPTQKPVALFEYLIRTYTAPGDLVVDPFVGGGTTALAARNTGRHYICGDNMLEYVEEARRRLAEPYTLPMFPETIEDHKEEPCQIELLAS